MPPAKVGAIICAVICAICLFIAVERYQSNASSVNAMNQFSGGLIGSMKMKPGVPAETKYAGFFGVLAGLGAVAFLVVGNRERQ